MLIELVRENTRKVFEQATNEAANGDTHAGLLLDKGYPREPTKGSSESSIKTSFIQSLCKTKAGTFYVNAFRRWLGLTNNNPRFMQMTMKLDNRLFIGLSGTGALETGCAISHTYGMPYIPGSSIKGAVRNWARQNLKEQETQWKALLGSAPDADDKDSFSGLVTFHDAWWVPNTAPITGGSDKNSPFVQEIVTTHHSEYYGNNGETEASDLDSPIPNALIGVHGSFLFVVESANQRYINIAAMMLRNALSSNGIGAKTSSGYGYLNPAPELLEELNKQQRKTEMESDFIVATLLYESGKVAAKLPDGKDTSYCTEEKSTEYMSLLYPDNLDKKGREKRNKEIKAGKIKIEVMIELYENFTKIVDLRPLTTNKD